MSNYIAPPMIPLAELKKRREISRHKIMKTQPEKQFLKLKGVDGMYKDAVFPLDSDIIMGRDYRVANVVFGEKAQKISRSHCKLRVRSNGEVVLIDLGSSNGTYLADGSKLKPQIEYHISKGECFYLADKQELFRII